MGYIIRYKEKSKQNDCFYFLYEDEKKRRSRAMNSLQTAIIWHPVEYLSRLLYLSKREMFSFQPNKVMSSLLEHGYDEKQRLYFFFSGTSSSTFFSSLQKGSTVS